MQLSKKWIDQEINKIPYVDHTERKTYSQMKLRDTRNGLFKVREDHESAERLIRYSSYKSKCQRLEAFNKIQEVKNTKYFLEQRAGSEYALGSLPTRYASEVQLKNLQ